MEPFSSKIEIALRDELHSYIGPRYSARQVTRSVMGFRRLTPQFCSIYDPHFWRHERLWKLLGGAAFSGTPFKSVIWRLFGVKIGKRVYDAGLNMPEKTLVTIGDECTFNEGNTSRAIPWRTARSRPTTSLLATAAHSVWKLGALRGEHARRFHPGG